MFTIVLLRKRIFRIKMAMNQRNSGSIDLIGQLHLKKPKMVLAAILISVMVLMWAKVLLGSR